ncbi:MAG: LytTR family DNA-binding domain-containing protein [Saccharofermentans sp.]|nr:LytTR family DNA-binding domain-containing protein [Saccharofermentans sp.]
MYNLAILEDEKIYIQIIQEKVQNLFPDAFCIRSYSDVEELKNDISEFTPDILLSDIRLENDTAIDYASFISRHNPNTQIIFISAYDEYVQDIFAANPVYYVKKPIGDTILETAINKAIINLSAPYINKKKYLTIKSNSEIMNIPMSDISYLESSKRIIICHTPYKDYNFYAKLSSISMQLDQDFVQCHQSFIVNMKEIKSFTRTTLTLKSGTIIPISQTRYKSTQELYTMFLARLIK